MNKTGKGQFKPGQKPPPGAGRPKGALSKRTVEFLELLKEKNFNPGEALIEVFFEQKKLYDLRRELNPQNISGAAELLVDMAGTLNDICQYVYPRKKAIEHTGEINIKTFSDFIALGSSGGGGGGIKDAN